MSKNPWTDTGLSRTAANHDALTPLTFLERAEYVFPDNVAVVYGSQSQTWKEHAAYCRKFASALQQASIGTGDVVSLMMANTPPMLAAHFAVPMAGGILNTINTRLDAATVAYILEHSEAKLIIADAEYLETVRNALMLLPEAPRLIVYADAEIGHTTADGVETLEDFLCEGRPEAFVYNIPDDEWSPISMNYTSGTTGRPKGVVYSHRGAYLSAVSNIVSWDVPRGAVYLWTLPLFHCNGWTMPWVVALQGGKNVCLRKVDGEKIVSLIVSEAVTHYCGAPIVHGVIKDAALSAGVRFNPPVAALIGGAPPPASLIAAMNEVGVSLTHIYGLTETYGPASICETHDAWMDFSAEERAKLMARQGVRYALQAGLTVMDPSTMRPVPADGETIGEIMFRGNMTMMGYFKDPEATAKAFSGGWFHSGDLAVLDADGYARIKDRSKDIIISGGENISSVEVEDALYRHPSILTVAVVAMPDDRWGEVPVAFLEFREGATHSDAELTQHCRQHLASFKCPRRFVIASIPKTATGKIQKNVLREMIIALQSSENIAAR